MFHGGWSARGGCYQRLAPEAAETDGNHDIGIDRKTVNRDSSELATMPVPETILSATEIAQQASHPLNPRPMLRKIEGVHSGGICSACFTPVLLEAGSEPQSKALVTETSAT